MQAQEGFHQIPVQVSDVVAHPGEGGSSDHVLWGDILAPRERGNAMSSPEKAALQVTPWH